LIEREITLESGGTTYVLAASLGALRKVAQRWPRMEDALGDLRGLHFDACAYIVAAAAELKQDKAEQVVFGAGLAKATAACVDFLAFLINPDGSEAEGPPGNP